MQTYSCLYAILLLILMCVSTIVKSLWGKQHYLILGSVREGYGGVGYSSKYHPSVALFSIGSILLNMLYHGCYAIAR